MKTSCALAVIIFITAVIIGLLLWYRQTRESDVQRVSSRSVWIYVLVLLASLFIWRGAWNIIDLYLLPKDALLSNTISLCVGIVLLILIVVVAPDHLVDLTEI